MSCRHGSRRPCRRQRIFVSPQDTVAQAPVRERGGIRPPLCSRRPPPSIVCVRGAPPLEPPKIWWRPPDGSLWPAHPAGFGGGGGTLTPLAVWSTLGGRGCGPRHPIGGVLGGYGRGGSGWHSRSGSLFRAARALSWPTRAASPPPSVAVVHSPTTPPPGAAATSPSPPPTVTAYPTPPRCGASLGGPPLRGVEARPQRGAHGRTARVTARIFLGRARRIISFLECQAVAAVAAAAAAAPWAGLLRCPRYAHGRAGGSCWLGPTDRGRADAVLGSNPLHGSDGVAGVDSGASRRGHLGGHPRAPLSLPASSIPIPALVRVPA